jgi:hypothetical protein
LIASIFEDGGLLISFAGASSEEVLYDCERQNFADPEDIFDDEVTREADSLILAKRSLIIL